MADGVIYREGTRRLLAFAEGPAEAVAAARCSAAAAALPSDELVCATEGRRSDVAWGTDVVELGTITDCEAVPVRRRGPADCRAIEERALGTDGATPPAESRCKPLTG